MEHPSPGPLFHKPQSIVAAKNILYAVLFLEIITWAIARWMPGGNLPVTAQTVVTLIVTVAIIFALIKFVTMGMKWARVVLLVLFILGLVVYVWGFRIVWQTNILIAVLSLLQTVLEAVALGFLFARESTLWFDRVREKAADEPHK
jgi:NADH:ubiquinone oxidoreductase subunit 6 (subunit J)